MFSPVNPSYCCYAAADFNCKSDNDCTEGPALAGSSSPYYFVCHSGTCIYVIEDVCAPQAFGGGYPLCLYDAQIENYCMTDLPAFQKAESGAGSTPSAPTPTSNTAACIVPGKSSDSALSDVAP